MALKHRIAIKNKSFSIVKKIVKIHTVRKII